MSDIAIARAEDEGAVVALWLSCGLVVPANDPVADFRFALEGACSDVLLTKSEDLIVASAMVGHDGHRGWIYYLATSPRHRLRGFGRNMVQASEDWMTKRGVPKSQLLIREMNTQVLAFYERLGYVAIPRVTMQKVLRAPHQTGVMTSSPR